MRRYPGGGAFALFFHPHPREFAPQDKNSPNARGLAPGGGGGMGAAGAFYILVHFLPFCAEQQREMTKFKVLWRT